MDESAAAVMGDPLARAIFRVLRDQPEADRGLVYAALVDWDDTASIEIEVEALRACMSDLGKPPSRRDYDDWRGRDGRPKEVPSSTAIRSACGSWTKALSLAGVATAPDVLARRLGSRGREFSHAQLISALKLFAAENPETRRTARRYREWAPTAIAQGEGVPLHTQVFVKKFGSFANGLAAASISAVRTRPMPPANAIADEQVVAALARAVDDLGFIELTIGKYRRWREHRIEEECPEPIPSVERIYLQFPDWKTAVFIGYTKSERWENRVR